MSDCPLCDHVPTTTYRYVRAKVDDRETTIRISENAFDRIMAMKPQPAPPPPETNGVWTVGDRVKPIGWTPAPTATVVSVSEHGVKVEFDSGELFSFVNECIEAA